MNINNKFLAQSMIKLGMAFFLLCLLAGEANADQLPVATNVPVTLTANIITGMKFVEIPFSLSGVDGVIIEVIVPVNGASFTLLDPQGKVALAPGDASVKFESGAVLAPKKSPPGGVFSTQELNEPTNGTWKIRLDFPSAPVNTVAMATVFTRTSYQAGIVTDRENYLSGEDVSVGMLIINGGQPVKSLAPQIQISLKGSSIKSTKVGLDNGVNPDGLANDGLYSVDYTFPKAGQYQIIGQATIPTAKGKVTRKADRLVNVTEPPLQVTSVSAKIIFGAGSCVAGIEEKVDFNVTKPGEYIVRGTLTANGGAALEARSRSDLLAGLNSIILFYSNQDIKSIIAKDGPYDFKDLDVLSGNLTLASRDKGIVGTTPLVKLDSLCREPIEIGQVTVEPIIADGYISALKFNLPINVLSGGNYDVSFKVIGSAGEDIGLVGGSQLFSAGANVVSITLLSDKFLNADGPYAAISALVYGAGGTMQQSRTGESQAYRRWQFMPKRAGDLDNDEDVDVFDRNIIINALNKPALSPGDRRDVFRDGKIDIRDTRAILGLR